ncbi:hypothetical protein [Catellatospora sp. NPDC049133]|uniref:hypothetical protein n=1 Tax=Catellatospora sp. NPDC049133 TaxID=3155499 RepID=UPI0033FF3054
MIPTLTDDCHAILHDPTAPDALRAWAAGAATLRHAMDFYTLPADPARLARHTAVSQTGTLWVASTAKGVALTRSGTGRDPVWTVPWTRIAALMTAERVGAALHREIREAMRTRRERTPEYDPRRKMSWYGTEEARAEARLWQEIETRCYQLASQAWQRCRPAAAPVQLDLFDSLLAA